MSGKGPYFYACLDCRKTYEDKELKMRRGMKCPNCGGPAYYVKDERKLYEDIHDHLWILYFCIGLEIVMAILFILDRPKDPLRISGIIVALTLMSLMLWLSYNDLQTKTQVYQVAYGKKKDNTLKE